MTALSFGDFSVEEVEREVRTLFSWRYTTLRYIYNGCGFHGEHEGCDVYQSVTSFVTVSNGKVWFEFCFGVLQLSSEQCSFLKRLGYRIDKRNSSFMYSVFLRPGMPKRNLNFSPNGWPRPYTLTLWGTSDRNGWGYRFQPEVPIVATLQKLRQAIPEIAEEVEQFYANCDEQIVLKEIPFFLEREQQIIFNALLETEANDNLVAIVLNNVSDQTELLRYRHRG